MIKAILQACHEPIVVLDHRLTVVALNPAARALFQVQFPESTGMNLWELGGGILNIPELKILLEQPPDFESGFDGLEIERDVPSLGRRVLRLNGRLVAEPAGNVFVLGIQDATAEFETELRVRDAATLWDRQNQQVRASLQTLWCDLRSLARAVDTAQAGESDAEFLQALSSIEQKLRKTVDLCAAYDVPQGSAPARFTADLTSLHQAVNRSGPGVRPQTERILSEAA